MRKQSEKAPAPFFNIGASSLLVIFLILCLVTFAILTLTSAKSDSRLCRETGSSQNELLCGLQYGRKHPG